MRVYLLLSLFLFGVLVISAQCPATIEVIKNPSTPVCKDTEVTFSATPSAGNITNYIWVINGDTVSNNPVISTNTNGAHVELYAVSDTCNNDTIHADTYLINVEIQAEYNVVIEECNQPVADIQILDISGGQEPYSYSLYTSGGDLGEQSTYRDVAVSTYPLVVTDDNGCEDTTWVDMTAVSCPEPTPIKVFTPNEDGYNDKWYIANIEYYPNNEVFIYDRWGQRVYHKKEYTNQDAWEAKYIGLNMPVSTYYYILKINYQKQDEKVYNGAISIFR